MRVHIRKKGNTRTRDATRNYKGNLEEEGKKNPRKNPSEGKQKDDQINEKGPKREKHTRQD